VPHPPLLPPPTFVPPPPPPMIAALPPLPAPAAAPAPASICGPGVQPIKGNISSKGIKIYHVPGVHASMSVPRGVHITCDSVHYMQCGIFCDL
jgi:hypothetical protein